MGGGLEGKSGKGKVLMPVRYFCRTPLLVMKNEEEIKIRGKREKLLLAVSGFCTPAGAVFLSLDVLAFVRHDGFGRFSCGESRRDGSRDGGGGWKGEDNPKFDRAGPVAGEMSGPC